MQTTDPVSAFVEAVRRAAERYRPAFEAGIITGMVLDGRNDGHDWRMIAQPKTDEQILENRKGKLPRR